MTEKQFTDKWFDDQHANNWSRFLEDKARTPNINCLEIGCYEGLATCWLMDNILTDNSSRMYCVDTFGGGYEHNGWVDFNKTKNNFLNNTKEYGEKVVLFEGKSSEWLLRQEIRCREYDFIYIDGCHESREVMEDAVFSFGLLKLGGVMVFDDYHWGNYTEQPTMAPRVSIDGFLKSHAKYIKLIHMGYQVAVRRII